ncbi:MAG TPA: plastocyanin/azurin family copper-binding protein [Thermoleophilaceae bacterium]|nr:plastocyanin/azurin family copper-binding protein [Thermoleophilaceae bacterium]
MTRKRLLSALAIPVGLGALAVAPSATGISQTVGISGFAFSPNTVSIEVGDGVTWRWNGPDTNHSVTSVTGPEGFDSDPGESAGQVNHAVGESFTRSFTRPGRYGYICKVHPDMQGIVDVIDPNAPPAAEDATRPSISSFEANPARFCKRHRRCSRPGTLLSFRLSERADVNIQAIGRSRGKRVVRTFELGERRAGVNRVRFQGTRLPLGLYLLKMTATDAAGNSSRIARKRVRIIPPPAEARRRASVGRSS